MSSALRHCAIMLGVLALAACGSDADNTSGPTEGNKVLKGTASDEMIAYESLKSEPPLAKIEVKDGAVSAGSSAGPSIGSSATAPVVQVPVAADTPEPEPAAEPAE